MDEGNVTGFRRWFPPHSFRGPFVVVLIVLCAFALLVGTLPTRSKTPAACDSSKLTRTDTITVTDGCGRKFFAEGFAPSTPSPSPTPIPTRTPTPTPAPYAFEYFGRAELVNANRSGAGPDEFFLTVVDRRESSPTNGQKIVMRVSVGVSCKNKGFTVDKIFAWLSAAHAGDLYISVQGGSLEFLDYVQSVKNPSSGKEEFRHDYLACITMLGG